MAAKRGPSAYFLFAEELRATARAECQAAAGPGSKACCHNVTSCLLRVSQANIRAEARVCLPAAGMGSCDTVGARLSLFNSYLSEQLCYTPDRCASGALYASSVDIKHTVGCSLPAGRKAEPCVSRVLKLNA